MEAKPNDANVIQKSAAILQQLSAVLLTSLFQAKDAAQNQDELVHLFTFSSFRRTSSQHMDDFRAFEYTRKLPSSFGSSKPWILPPT